MYDCMHAFVYVYYVCRQATMNLYVSMQTCTSLYIYIYMYACMYVCIQANMYVHVYVHACMQICMYACMCVCFQICMYVWMHAYMDVCRQTYMSLNKCLTNHWLTDTDRYRWDRHAATHTWVIHWVTAKHKKRKCNFYWPYYWHVKATSMPLKYHLYAKYASLVMYTYKPRISICLIWTQCNQQCDSEQCVCTSDIISICPWTSMPATLHIYVPLYCSFSVHIDLTLLYI